VVWQENPITQMRQNRNVFWTHAALPIAMYGLGVIWLVTGNSFGAILSFALGTVFLPLILLLRREFGKEKSGIPSRIEILGDRVNLEFKDATRPSQTRVESVGFGQVVRSRDENRSRAYTPGRVEYMPPGLPLPPASMNWRARKAAGQLRFFLNEDNLERFRMEYYVWKRNRSVLSTSVPPP
jgi:hypothetical protein